MKNQKEKTNQGLTRRNFIRNASLAGAGFIIVPRHVLGGKNYIAPSDRLVVAGIGVGGMGFHDVKGVSNSRNAEIGFLCDVDDNRAKKARELFPQAKYYKDWREMLDKEHQSFDAVTISTPDHNHAAPALKAMQMNKHVYVQKPLTHDIYEARVLTQAAEQYRVVTQMGNQGASGEGVRKLTEWYGYDLIGDVHTVYCWTDRPIWPQGIPWPDKQSPVPEGLDWDLWQGTAPYKDYVDGVVPFNWRGWWDYGTGAIGDMGCHIVESAFTVLGLKKVTHVQASVGAVYEGEFKKAYYPEGFPPSSNITLTFEKGERTKGPVKLHWMDGGIKPERPEELNEKAMFGDGESGTLFIGTKGKMMCGTYGEIPNLIPTELTRQYVVNETIPRVLHGSRGHYSQWVEACLKGYGNSQTSSPFSLAGPLTESLLIANLAIKAQNIRHQKSDGKGFEYPGRDLILQWDDKNMKVTNLDELNQFVKRDYPTGYSLDFKLKTESNEPVNE